MHPDAIAYVDPVIRHPATNGPAYLDINNGVAHKNPQCPSFVDAVYSAKADDGAMSGFGWCESCGTQAFMDSEDW